MIQSHPHTTVSRGPILGLILTVGLAAGFIAGQASPGVLDGLFRTSVQVEQAAPRGPALTEVDDYGTRHAGQPVLTQVDDYGTRHAAP